VVAELLVSKRTLDTWLAADLLRAIDDRRFQFHTMRGRKRIWSTTAFQNLEAAIERESAPGGVLAGSGSKSETASGTLSVPFGSQAVQSASDKVLAWPLRPPPKAKPKARLNPSSKISRRRLREKPGVVILLR
jgi:hypothetical protein